MTKTLLISFLLFVIIESYGQQLIPTETDALLKVSVTDLDDVPSFGEIISFINKDTQQSFEGITDKEGKFEILIPKGHHYIVQYRNFGYDHQYAEHEIPAYDGKLVSKINIKYRLPSKSVLEDVYFENDKVTLNKLSFPSLDKLVELLKVKLSTRIKLVGHVNKQESLQKSMAISLKQAKAVRNYLIAQGIKLDRIETEGLGSRFPLVQENSSEGKSQNQRIEVQILK